jgi:hypothetical protein
VASFYGVVNELLLHDIKEISDEMNRPISTAELTSCEIGFSFMSRTTHI